MKKITILLLVFTMLLSLVGCKKPDQGGIVTPDEPSPEVKGYLVENEDYIDLKGLWGVELYNTGCARNGYFDSPKPLDDLLRCGNRIYPLATDDAHNMSHCFGGWLMVKAEKLEYATVIDALERGDFYASTGPEIHELSIEDGKLRVVTSPAASVILSTERRFSKRVDAKEDEPLTVAEFDLTAYLEQTQSAERKADSYVRVTVLNGKGKTAWSRAYRVEELSNINA